MKELLQKINDSRAVGIIRKILNSRYLPFVTAAVVMTCYYLGLELVTIYYIAALVIGCVLLLDDVTPVVGVFVFMQCMISRQHSPSITVGGSDFLSHPAVIAQFVLVIVLMALAAVARIAYCIAKKKIKTSPVMWGLCALAASLLLNGAFMRGYDPMNLFLGFALGALFLGIFVLVSSNIKTDKENFIKVAFAFLAVSVMLVVELFVVYLTSDGIYVDGEIIKEEIVFGWGVWNTMGMMLVLCVPFIVFLAARLKHGYLLYLYSYVVAVASVMSMSRQSMLAVAVVFPVSIVTLLVKGRYKIANGAITALAVAAAAVCIVLYREKFVEFVNAVIKTLVNIRGEYTGNGRVPLLEMAVENWLAAPIFGSGFYVELEAAAPFDGLNIIPDMYHNTFAQMLASCGIVGLTVYIVHRIQTIVSFFRRPTTERTFFATALLGLLICSLFDNHMFYMFPTVTYSCLLAFLVNSESRS